MTTHSIAQETPGQRQRRLFCKAMAVGCQVIGEVGGEFTVTSKSSSNQYIVSLDNDDAGRMIVHCTCDWAERKGWMLDNKEAPACCHMMIVRWHRADDTTKDNTIALHPDIAAAVFVGRYAARQAVAA